MSLHTPPPSPLSGRWHWHFRRSLHRGVFDVVHRLSPWLGLQPSYLASACPVPFVLGPVNDHLPSAGPQEMRDQQTAAMRFAARVLPLMRRLPYQRSKYERASAILACYDHTIAGLPDAVQHKAINFPEVGFDLRRSGCAHGSRRSRKRSSMWVGLPPSSSFPC